MFISSNLKAKFIEGTELNLDLELVSTPIIQVSERNFYRETKPWEQEIL